jgi:ParB-like nuclease domain
MAVTEPETRTVRKRVASLKPSPENGQLYDYNAADIQEFAARIRAEGLLEYPIVTSDNYIVSGHRRHAALTRLGQVFVTCRVLPFRRADLTTDDYIALLRRYNRQRDKSVAEKVRETMVDIDADDAWANLCYLRDKSVNAAEHNGVYAIDIEGTKRRYEISEDKAEHVKYVLQVLEERRPYWPLSVRGVHYPLLNFNFVRGYCWPHRGKLGFGTKQTLYYKNDQGSYDATSDLLTRLRLNETVPWEALDDPTRPAHVPRPFENVQRFLRQEAENLFKGYWRDLLQTQPNYVACLVEKNTVCSTPVKAIC